MWTESDREIQALEAELESKTALTDETAKELKIVLERIAEALEFIAKHAVIV